jgi:hypothetical protein
MPSPQASEVHVSSLLTGFSVGYLQSLTAYVADQVFPRMPVTKQSDKYATFALADFFRDSMRQRADGTESAGIDYTVSTDSYQTQLFALHMDIGRRVQANADAAHNPLQDATRILTQQELIKRERDWHTTFMTSTPWDTTVTGGTDFEEMGSASSDPIGFIGDQKLTIQTNTGFEPRTLVTTSKGWLKLRLHPDIVGRVDRGQTSGAAAPTKADVAALLDLDNIHVSGATYNTAQQGIAASMARVNTNDALLCYVDPNPGLMSPTAGLTFVWTGDVQGAEGRTISTLELPTQKATRVEIESEWAHKVVSGALGTFISGFTA